MRKLAVWGLAVAATLAAAYWWLAIDGRMPDDAEYTLDLAEVRRLARALPGSRPLEIHYEKVAAYAFPRVMITAGDDWSGALMPVYSYQVVYPDRTAIIDTALDRSLATPDFMVPFYDEAAYRRVEAALDKAALIVVTHEHADHIGGIARHPRPAALLPALQLTATQLAHTDRMKPAVLPQPLIETREPLRYDNYLAVAPGMVLIAAPGHTPGSQMVYVQLADGRELLFLGDVSWHTRNIETQRERPRFVTALLIREDRKAVFGQLRTLHALARQEPGLHQVPGHDGPVIAALTQSGVLLPGFLAADASP